MTFREYLETKIFNLTDRDTLPYEEVVADDILKEIEKRIDAIHLPFFVGGQYTQKELNDLAIFVLGKVKTEILLK